MACFHISLGCVICDKIFLKQEKNMHLTALSLEIEELIKADGIVTLRMV